MADSQYYIPLLIEIVPAAPEQEPILANLLEFYAHDFSEFMDLELGPDGRFGYEHLSLYWKEAGRHPFLIKVSGNLAGFALVHQGSQISGAENVWDMAEFFIVRGRRRLGIGMKAAQAVWKRFPGKWEIRVRDRNRGAKEFWTGTITAFVGKPILPVAFEKDGELRYVFSFTSD
jgi:predicted acetyltransferase